MLKIGALELEFPVVQAAMAGYTDLAMRRVARLHGAVYAMSEVVLDQIVLAPGRKRRGIMKVAPDDHPVGGQLMGARPESFAAAAAAMVEAGYDVIDINFGCPVRKVLGRCRGGFLLSQPRTALEIIERVLEAVAGCRPVTVKMRRGMDDSAESRCKFFEILDGAYERGIAAVTVHARTVKQRYAGPSRWEFLAEVRQHLGDRVLLGSGDLFTAEDCLRMMEQTGVDGVTVARGCIGNPWIFSDCRALLMNRARTASDNGARSASEGTGPARRASEGIQPARSALVRRSLEGEAGSEGILPDPPSVAEQGRTIAQHFAWAVEEHGAARGGKIMRKFGIKYSELHPCGRQVRDAFIAVRTPEDWQRVLARWYDPDVAWPPVQRKTGPGQLIAAGAE